MLPGTRVTLEEACMSVGLLLCHHRRAVLAQPAVRWIPRRWNKGVDALAILARDRGGALLR